MEVWRLQTEAHAAAGMPPTWLDPPGAPCRALQWCTIEDERTLHARAHSVYVCVCVYGGPSGQHSSNVTQMNLP